MGDAERMRRDQALDWARRVQDAGFQDWEAHAVWLESDPRNADAFDDACLTIEDAVRDLAPAPATRRPVRPASIPVNDNHRGEGVAETGAPARRHSLRLRGAGVGAVAAMVVGGLVALPSLMPGGARPYIVHTAPGERREIALADGSKVALNGDTSLRLDHGNGRAATLEKGEAFFTVVHNAADPFTVQAGGSAFQDVGTAFDVKQGPEGTRVAVREGAVLYDPKGSALRLDGGQAIAVTASGAVVRQVAAEDVGGWRQGRLVYRDTPIADVAADVARSIGRPVTVDGRIGRRSFTGVIVIDPDRPRMMRRMASAMDASAVAEGTGWRITPNLR